MLQPGPLPDFEGPGRVRAESFGSSGASSPPEQVLPGSDENETVSDEMVGKKFCEMKGKAVGNLLGFFFLWN